MGGKMATYYLVLKPKFDRIYVVGVFSETKFKKLNLKNVIVRKIELNKKYNAKFFKLKQPLYF